MLTGGLYKHSTNLAVTFIEGGVYYEIVCKHSQDSDWTWVGLGNIMKLSHLVAFSARTVWCLYGFLEFDMSVMSYECGRALEIMGSVPACISSSIGIKETAQVSRPLECL